MLYVIAGDGSGNKTEILSSLSDLREAAALKDQEFWFIFVCKPEQSKTDAIITKWCEDEGIWFEAIAPTEEDAYPGAQKVHTAKDGYRKALGILTKAEEDVAVLALPVEPEGENEDDAALFSFLERAMDAGTSVFLLNAQMAELALEGDEDEESDEDEDEDESDEEDYDSVEEDESDEDDEDDEEVEEDEEADEDEEEAEEEPVVFDRAHLRKMSLIELQSLAKGQKIDTKGMGKADLMVALINLNTEPEPEPEPEPAKPKRGSRATPAKAEETTGVNVVDPGSAVVTIVFNGTTYVRLLPAADAKALIEG